MDRPRIQPRLCAAHPSRSQQVRMSTSTSTSTSASLGSQMPSTSGVMEEDGSEAVESNTGFNTSRTFPIYSLPAELVREILGLVDSLEDRFNLCLVNKSFSRSWAREVGDHVVLVGMYKVMERRERHEAWQIMCRTLERRPSLRMLVKKFGDDGPGLLCTSMSSRLDDEHINPRPHQPDVYGVPVEEMQPIDADHRSRFQGRGLLYHPIDDLKLPDEVDMFESLPQLRELLDTSEEYDQAFTQITTMLPRLEKLDLTSPISDFKCLSMVLMKTARLQRLIDLEDDGKGNGRDGNDAVKEEDGVLARLSSNSQVSIDIPFRGLKEVSIIRSEGDGLVDVDLLRWLLRLPSLETLICDKLTDDGVDHGASRIGIRSNVRNIIWTVAALRNSTMLEEISNTTRLEIFHLDASRNAETFPDDQIEIESIVTALSAVSASTLRRLCLTFAAERVLQDPTSMDHHLGHFTSLENLQCHWEALMKTPAMASTVISRLPRSLKTLRLYCGSRPVVQQVDRFMAALSNRSEGDACLEEVSVTVFDDEWLTAFQGYFDPPGIRLVLWSGLEPTLPPGFGLQGESGDEGSDDEGSDDGEGSEDASEVAVSSDDGSENEESEDDEDGSEDDEDDEGLIDDSGQEADPHDYGVTSSGHFVVVRRAVGGT